MGRPTKYDPTHNIFVTKLCRLGATNEDLAVALEVDRSQVVRWSARNKDFRTAVKLGREESDAEVGERLTLEQLRERLQELRAGIGRKPLLAPHADSRSQDMLDALTLLEELWPSPRRATVRPFASGL